MRHVWCVTGFTGLHPQPAAGREAGRDALFRGHLGDRLMDVPTHVSIHPCLILQFLPTLKGAFGNLCAHVGTKPHGSYREEFPVLEISLRSSSLSAGNSLRSWRISFVFLCFPFPFRAEGNGTAFSQAGTELHPHWAAPLSFQPSTYTLCTSGRVQMWLDRSAVSAQIHTCCFMHLLPLSPGR